MEGKRGERYLTVSLGIFSVIRIVRSAQYLIQATEYCIPEKECVPVEEDDPCRVFRSMPFPTGEFCGQNRNVYYKMRKPFQESSQWF